jgi:hypothetical protein
VNNEIEMARELFEFRNLLNAAGFKEDDIAEIIRHYGTHIPVFGSQLDGVYIRSDTGQRDHHTATPGWYSILRAESGRVWIRKMYMETADVFECGTYWLPMIVMANMEMIDKGHPSPDDKFQPEGAVWMGQVSEQRIRDLVDTGGWDAVRRDPEMSKVWAEHLKASKAYVDRVVDTE